MLKEAGGLSFRELFEEFTAYEHNGQKACFSWQRWQPPQKILSKTTGSDWP